MRLLTLITLALGLGTLAGCGTKPVPATGVSPPAVAAAAPGAAPSAPSATPTPTQVRASLAAEHKRLSELFRGTPVVFTLQGDGSLLVEVPLSFCFSRGAFVVKPPLAAVLDRLARSQRSEPTRLRVAAVADAGSGAGASAQNLARDRAASTRDYLVARGVSATRVALVGATQFEGVEIVVTEAAAARR